MAAELTRQFAVLEAEGAAKLMSPQLVPVGLQGVDAIMRSALQAAHVVLALLSADFCAGEEPMGWLQWALSLRTRVIVVRLRDSDLPQQVHSLRMLPDDRPVMQWQDHDVAYAAVVAGVRGEIALGSLEGTTNLAPPSVPPLRDLWIAHLSGLCCGSDEMATLEANQLKSDLVDLQLDHLDGLVISGSLVSRAAASEYAGAGLFLRRIMGEFGLAGEQVLLAPGEQDADVAAAGFASFSAFYENVCGVVYPQQPELQVELRSLAEERLLMLGLNSAWRRSAPGSINAQALQHGLSALPRAPRLGQLRIAAFCHSAEASAQTYIRDTTFMVDLCRAGFHLALCGHSGRWRMAEQCVEKDGKRLALLAASPCHYNLLCFNPRALTVHTRRRNFERAAWRKDTTTSIRL